MNIIFFKSKDNNYKDILIAILFFILFFIYIHSFTLESAKGYLIKWALVREALTKEYGVWGYFTDYFYNFLNFLFGERISDINLMNTVLAFQVASIWSIVIYKIIKSKY